MEKAENKEKRGPKHAAKEKKKGVTAWICVICIFVAVLIGISVYANSYKNIYPNTYVGDKKVSDMSGVELSSYLGNTYSADKIKGQSIQLSCESNKEILNIDDLKVSFNNQATYDMVTKSGKDRNFFENTVAFIGRLIKPYVIDPVITYDTQVLATAIDNVTKGLETEPVGHTFTIGDNKIIINAPVNGIKVNRDRVVSDIEGQIKSMAFSSVNMPLEAVSPEPLDVDKTYKWLTADAENAYYEKIDGKVTVRPSKAKVDVDKSAITSAIEDLKASGNSTIEISAVTTQPEKTTEQLTNNLYCHTLGSYSTYYGGSTAARANNVRLAASRINGIELMPDEEFSYDKTILPRTTQNGYQAAPVYVGNKVESGLGGGICQPSSTLYVAALYANLGILERHNHSLAVSYMPPGLDATIAEGYLDLRLKNTTGYPIKIVANSDGGVIAFNILGYNPDNTKVELVRSAGGGRYYVTRVVYQNGAEIKREAMTSSAYGTPEKDEEEKKPEEEKKEDEKEEETKEGETPEAPEAPVETPPEAPAETPAEPAPEAPAPVPSDAPSLEN